MRLVLQRLIVQDLTYMWRSKLYADVEIHLVTNDPPAAPTLADDSDYDSSSSTASLASTAIFSSHRFILCSRSPYFASLLLNQSQFRPRSSSINRITLPSPPFTPAALHFCLGYLYNGTLNFSNRSYDLATAFQIHRCASYLQLDPLRDEVESRITWDFCHGLDPTLCACRRCGIRAARVWRFACAPDVAAVALGRRAREWLVKGWADSWGKDVGEISKTERDALVEQVVVGINPCNVLSTFRGLARVRARLDASSDWQAQLEDMLHAIESRATQVLMLQFADVADSQDVLALLDGTSFEADVLETVLNIVKDHVGRAEWYAQSGRIYQVRIQPAAALTPGPRLVLPFKDRPRNNGYRVEDGLQHAAARRALSGGCAGPPQEALDARSRSECVSCIGALGFEGNQRWFVLARAHRC